MVKQGGFTVGSITATMALLVREEDLAVNDKGKVVDVCVWEDIGRNVPREVLQAFMKERGKRRKLIKERKYM